jgi:phosphoribosylanthranilate isomerase
MFFPSSPRNVSFHAARELGARVNGRAEKVAVTVDADDATLPSIGPAAARPAAIAWQGDAGASTRSAASACR